MSLKGRTALVTGGGSGVGVAIAARLSEAGAEVTVCGRRPIQPPPGIRAEVCNITDEAAVARLFARGPFDIVVANAGASDSAPLTRTSLDQFRTMIDVNLTGSFLTIREALRTMPGDWGRVIAVASAASLKGYAYVAPYAAAKHGVLGLVRSAALEVAKKGITVNAVCPGFMDTEMTRRSVQKIVAKTGRTPDEARATLAATNPMQRLVPPADVAEAVLWLCGPGSGMVTGQAISISGGETQ
ncbi:MAG: SDR family NAD(P)-dependent oxidoreductase [Paracoccus sp. (in: a-proteobacteria)]|uniref:SDR family NAD(P)-dependent oxidoreductase n=1 Tax=Paracoccus sp. TaxID=267 RepID=UPI00405A1DFE